MMISNKLEQITLNKVVNTNTKHTNTKNNDGQQ